MPEATDTPQTPVGQKKPGQAGPMAGIAIIITLLLLGALYFLNQELQRQKNPPAYIPGDKVQE